MFLSSYELEHGRHVARLHHRRRAVVVVVVVVSTHPRAIPLAITYMRKSIPGFPFVPLYGYGARLGGLRPLELPYYCFCTI